MEQVRMRTNGPYHLWCTECGGERRFEQPPCLDGHGSDCPELACTDCGAAVLAGPVAVGEPEPVGVTQAPQAPQAQAAGPPRGAAAGQRSVA